MVGRVIERPLLGGGDPLAPLGRPAEHGRDSRQLGLAGERAADGAEADDAEFRGTHGKEGSRSPGTRKREGRLRRAALPRSHETSVLRKTRPPPIKAVPGAVEGNQIPRHAPLASVTTQG